MQEAKKRIGRPFKPAPEGKRVSLGLKVTAETKRRIDSAAKSSGRSQSQEAEHLIEQALKYERALGEVAQWQAKLRAENEEIERGDLETVLRRRNWQKVIGARFGEPNWISPNNHSFQKSGWVDPAVDAERAQQVAALDKQLENAIERVVTRAVRDALDELKTS